jgi:pSer/pThr/pTyr-binding forkhead associated (FHA) protein
MAKQMSEEIPNLPTRIKGEILPPAPDPMTVARLLVVKGNEEGNEYYIKKGTTGIGRATDNEIALTDLSCSRKHVQLIWEDDSLVIADLGGGNGTVLNKHRVTRTTLRNNDVFEIGNTQFKVELYAPYEESAAPVAAARPKAPEPKKPSAAVAQNQTVGLPGLQANMVGGVLPPTATGAQNLPGPFGGARPPSPLSEEAPSPAPARFSAPTMAASPESLAPPPMAAPAPIPASVATPAPVMTPAPADVAPAAAKPGLASNGLIQKLSAIGESKGKNWVYALAGGNAFAFVLGSALLFSGSGANASGIQRFNEGLAAYSKMDWATAEAAFKESLTLTPELTEASDYLRLTQNEQANAERLNTAKKLLEQPMVDAKTAVVVLSLAVSVPMESVSGGEAKQLAHKAKMSISKTSKTNAEMQMKQMNYQAAAFELKQVEAAYNGNLPDEFMSVVENLQKSSMQPDWHALLTQPAVAMANPTPEPMPEPMPEVKPEPMAMVTPEPTKMEPVKADPPMKMEEPKKQEPPAKVEEPKKQEPQVTAAKADPKAATPKETKEATKLDEKTAKANALSLYKEAKFSQAANEAKKNKKTEGLAKNIEAFEVKYGSAKSKYASNERATIYDTVKSAYNLDNTIMGGAGAFSAQLKPMIGPCADARARVLYDEGNKSPTNYAKLREAYTVAKDAQKNGVTTKSGPIIASLESEAKKKISAGLAAEKKNKPNEAIGLYAAVMEMMPVGTADYAEAKRNHDRVKAAQGSQ